MPTTHQPSTRKNLVIVRAGNGSLHREWLTDDRRDFDILISYFGPDQGRYEQDGDYYEARKGPKWPCIYELLKDQPGLLKPYDAVWFPDDDLSASTATINRMFAFFHAFGLSLAQPALTKNSYYAWDNVLQREEYLLRYVGFIEVMAPIFSMPALSACLQTFNESRSGWGLDWVWPQLCHARGETAIAIIDATPVKHTRPVGGELYKNNPEMDPKSDAQLVIQKYGIAEVRAVAKYTLLGGIVFKPVNMLQRAVAAIKKANGWRKHLRKQRNSV